MPTILEFLDIPGSPHSQGVNLLPAFDGKLEETPILLEATLHYYESESLGHDPIMITGLRTGEWKLVYVTVERTGGSSQMGELYNIVEDPRELIDVKNENQEVFNRLIREMHSMIKTHSADSVPKDNYLKMDKATREKMKALGYLK